MGIFLAFVPAVRDALKYYLTLALGGNLQSVSLHPPKANISCTHAHVQVVSVCDLHDLLFLYLNVCSNELSVNCDVSKFL